MSSAKGATAKSLHDPAALSTQPWRSKGFAERASMGPGSRSPEAGQRENYVLGVEVRAQVACGDVRLYQAVQGSNDRVVDLRRGQIVFGAGRLAQGVCEPVLVTAYRASRSTQLCSASIGRTLHPCRVIRHNDRTGLEVRQAAIQRVSHPPARIDPGARVHRTTPAVRR